MRPMLLYFIRMGCAIIACSLAMVLGVGIPSIEATPSAPRILVLNSYHDGYDWSDDELTGIQSTLLKAFPGTEFFFENLDTKKFPRKAHFPLEADMLEAKYGANAFDIIMALDNAALEFALRYRQQLFPAIPLVFCGINGYVPDMIAGQPRITGVAENQDAVGTLALALRLHPATREVVVVHDYTDTGIAIRRELEAAAGQFPSVRLHYLEEMSLEQAQDALKKLQADRLVLMLSYAVDKAGKAFTQAEAARIISSASPVPVYGVHARQLGNGLVGGRMLSGQAQGQKAAELAIRVLQGSALEILPVFTENLSTPMFDYRVLERFGIDPARLPDSAVVINTPASTYAINKTAFWVGALFSVVTSTGVITLYLGIQRRKRLEKTLRLAEAKFRQLFDSAGDAIFICDFAGNILEVNQAAIERMGYSRNEFLNSPLSRIVAPEQTPYIVKRFEAAIRHGRGLYESVHITCDGTRIPVEANCKVIEYEGKPAILNIVRDITERKQAADALNSEKERLAVTLRSIGDGVITTDTEGRVVLLNKVAEEMCGWVQHDAAGELLEKVFNIIGEGSRLPLKNPVVEVLATGATVELANHTVLVARDGSERIIADSAAPILKEDGAVIGVVLVFRDMTEKKRVEQELFNARKLESIGVLAGGIAHDFNNFLTAILGNISLANRLTTPGEKIHGILSKAEMATRRAAELTQQLLTFAKGGAPVCKITSIGQIIVDSTSFVLRGSNVGIEYAIADDLDPVEVDVGQISQVINNLVINANQAMPTGGMIRISAVNDDIRGHVSTALPAGRYVRITIEDDGVGIPEENLGRIFDPYFTTKQSGSGLGLATCYSILRNHNSSISVTSELGQGTTFTILIPAAEQGNRASRSDREEAPFKGHGRILVMDDDDTILQVVTDIMDSIGFETVAAKDGQEAIEHFTRARAEGRGFDVIIMDITIPGGMGGREAIARIREIDPQVRAIVSSGYANTPILAACKEFGFAAALTKPYDVTGICSVLKQVLATQ